MKGMSIGFNFVPLPKAIWTQNIPLTLGEFRLLGYLLYYRSRFGHERIKLTDDELLRGVKDREGNRLDSGCGLTTNSLKEARIRLIEKTWLTLEEDLRDRARPKRLYSLNIAFEDPPLSETDSRVSETDSLGCENLTVGLSESDTRSDSRSSRTSRTPYSPPGEDVQNHSHTQPRAAAAAYSEDFESFWNGYDDQRGTKKKAWAAWERLRTRGKLPDLGFLFTAILEERNSRQWQEEEGRYIPHASSWLNAERFVDVIERLKQRTDHQSPPPPPEDWETDPEEEIRQ